MRCLVSRIQTTGCGAAADDVAGVDEAATVWEIDRFREAARRGRKRKARAGAGRGQRWTSPFCFGCFFFGGGGGGRVRAGEVTGVMNETKNIRCVGGAEEGAGKRGRGRFR